jgi:hypothetical protein
MLENLHIDKAHSTINIEGTKGNRGSLRFGNSDPFVIDLFLNLMEKCYSIDKKKFRCTVLCRADQDTKELDMVPHSNNQPISPISSSKEDFTQQHL